MPTSATQVAITGSIITHGGYGTGQSLSVIARLAPKARLREAFTLQMDQEREILRRVTRWLGTVNVRS